MRRRFYDAHGQDAGLFWQRLSAPLRTTCLFWAGRLSFGDVARLLAERCGTPLFSEDSLWRLVQEEAARLDAQKQEQIADCACLPDPLYRAGADLYDAQAWEYLVLTDGIGVKAQKPTRERADQPRSPGLEKRHDTDVMLLPRRDGAHQIVCEGVSENWSLVEAARAFLRQEWQTTPLWVVAITDGAKTIRCDLSALFGTGVRVILDWYHLEKRVYEQLSMAAHSKTERQEWEQHVLRLLWRGQAQEAILYLSGLRVRQEKGRADLIGYLEKHAEEIIDYERRRAAGKPIGSGRMEQSVNQVVGKRQKGKGMSWTKAGSRALALLRVAELNACADAASVLMAA